MRYRLRTIMLAIAGSTAPIYAATEGYKAGCLPTVVIVWVLMVILPLALLVLLLPFAKPDEGTRDELIAIFGSFAVVGYFFAIFGSMIVIGFAHPWSR